MEQSKTFEVVFPDPDDLLNFKLHVTPDEGYYKGGKFTFSIKVRGTCKLLINSQRCEGAFKLSCVFHTKLVIYIPVIT